MKTLFFQIILLFVFQLNLFSQNNDTQIYQNQCFVNYIKTIQFGLNNNAASLPILTLKGTDKINLSFDDLEADNKDYVYKFIHCNADWTKSVMDEMDFLDGFLENRITLSSNSSRTSVSYTHFQLNLPNENIKFLLSGNYIIQIIDEDAETVVFQRRFMIKENLMSTIPTRTTTTADVEKFNTHHEFDFITNYKGVKLLNPKQEITATILQNSRWDNAILDVKPAFFRDEKLIFDLQDKVVFEGGKEYRRVDLRPTNFYGEHVFEIVKNSDGSGLTFYVRADKKRSFSPILALQDYNGSFVIENANEQIEHETRSDYFTVFFSLENSANFDEYDIYLFGELTNWEVKEDYKMTLREGYNYLMTNIQLKQGYYNYSYIAKNKKTGALNLEVTEGNWHETENQYSFLVYLRSFNDRYDRLVSYATIHTGNQ